MAPRSPSWRSSFATLRRAASSGFGDVEAVRELLLNSSGLSRSAFDLPPQEITGDLSLLIQIVSSNWSFHSNAAEAANVYGKCADLVGAVSSHVQLELKSSAALAVSSFLREIIDSRRQQIQQFVPETLAEELYSSALNALAQFIYVSGQQLPSEQADAILQSLLPFMIYHRPSGRNKRGSGSDYTAFVVAGNVFTRFGSSVSKSTWVLVVQAYRKVLDQVASQIVEDAAASRFYAAFFRSLHLVLSDVKGPFDEHVGGFVASLRMFLAYGLPGSRFNRAPDTQQPSAASSTAEASKTDRGPKRGSSLYRPPHLRAKQDVADSTRTNVDDERKAFFSDSEQSDSDALDTDQFRSSKTRTNAILSIQAIARADPKLLHAHWSLLLPTDNVFHARLSQPTLLTTLLFDPILKTRLAAISTLSALLEGPARAFLQAAEYRESGRTGSFTTLSSSLGQIVFQLYKGLLHLILNESHSSLLTGALKSLSLLVSATPFDRLPPGLLPDVIHAVHKRMQSTSDQSLLVSSFNCLNATLCASATSSRVTRLLIEPPADSAPPKSFLGDLIFFGKSTQFPTVSVEALQTLRAAVHSHGAIGTQIWTAVLELVEDIVDRERNAFFSAHRVVDEKTVYHAVKLLDETLRAISGFKGAEDMFESTILPPSPSQLPQPVKLVKGIDEASGNMEILSLTSDAAGAKEWVEVLERHLPSIIRHAAPVVRAAALTCFAGLTPGVFSALSQANQTFVFSTVVRASIHDDAASVRSAACRALGVVAGFLEITGRQDRLESTVDTVRATISDASLSVRITSCWALANICDALSKNQAGSELFTTLVELALKAAKDGDKVRANAVRALGNLARFVDFTASDDGGDRTSTAPHWLGKMVQTLVSCITTGNVKVQWNVCHALGNLFLNKTIRLQHMAWAPSVYSILLLLLRDSGNFKIRIHAVSALAVPSYREDFGVSYGDVVHGLVHVLESQDTEQKAAPSSFKYMSTLSEQLTNTCLHVLTLAKPEDYTTLKDTLHKRSPFLQTWLQMLSTGSSSRLGHDGAARHRLMCLACAAAEVIGDMFEYGGEKTLSSKFKNLIK